jgi:hypothetical protein
MDVFVVAALVAWLEQATQPSTDEASLRRIRAALAKPAPTLVVRPPAPQPTFTVTVEQHPYFIERPFVWTFAGGGTPTTQRPTGPGQPLMTVSVPVGGGGEGGVVPMLRAVRSAIQEHAAHSEVERAMAEFCATHSC